MLQCSCGRGARAPFVALQAHQEELRQNPKCAELGVETCTMQRYTPRQTCTASALSFLGTCFSKRWVRLEVERAPSQETPWQE